MRSAADLRRRVCRAEQVFAAAAALACQAMERA